MAFDKKLLVRVGTGVVVVAVMAFGIAQCNRAETYKDKYEEGDSICKNVSDKAKTLVASADSLQKLLNEKARDLRDAQSALSQCNNNWDQLAEENESLRDSVAMLQDSLANVSARLNECKNSKKPAAPVAKKRSVSKPQPTKPCAPVAQPTKPCAPKCEAPKNNGQTNINIGNGSNNNDVRVNNGTIINTADTRPSYSRTITVEIERVRSRNR